MMHAMRNVVAVTGVLLLVFGVSADAQSPSGGRARQRGSELPRQKAENAVTRVSPATDAVAAIQRELPSLKVDLKINAEQTPAWNAFVSSVRQVREISLAAAKREMAARASAQRTRSESTEVEPPSALSFVTALVDEERKRVTAMADMQGALSALVEMLSAEQRKMLDRRIALAQREPLGAS